MSGVWIGLGVGCVVLGALALSVGNLLLWRRYSREKGEQERKR